MSSAVFTLSSNWSIKDANNPPRPAAIIDPAMPSQNLGTAKLNVLLRLYQHYQVTNNIKQNMKLTFNLDTKKFLHI
jgi:hypothetical protein